MIFKLSIIALADFSISAVKWKKNYFVSDKKRNHHNLSWADFATVQGMSSHGLTKRGSKGIFYDDDGNDYDDDDGAGLQIYNGD